MTSETCKRDVKKDVRCKRDPTIMAEPGSKKGKEYTHPGMPSAQCPPGPLVSKRTHTLQKNHPTLVQTHTRRVFVCVCGGGGEHRLIRLLKNFELSHLFFKHLLLHRLSLLLHLRHQLLPLLRQNLVPIRPPPAPRPPARRIRFPFQLGPQFFDLLAKSADEAHVRVVVHDGFVLNSLRAVRIPGGKEEEEEEEEEGGETRR